VLDKESAALPLLVSTALLRVALTPLAHALATYHIHHIALRPTKLRGRCGSAQHDACGGKLRQGMVCGIDAAVKTRQLLAVLELRKDLS
jgi:hypothetical protein